MTAFVEGVTGRNDKIRHAGGVCDSIRTAERTTKEALDMGVILKRRTLKGNEWSLNYDWETKHMKETRRIVRNPPPMADSDPPPMAASNPPPMADINSNYVTKGTATPNRTLSRPTARENSLRSITQALAKAKAKNSEAVARKELRKGGKLNSSDVLTHWATSIKSAPWLEYGDGIAANHYLTKKDSQALKSYLDRFKRAFPSEDVMEYLTWVIHNWQGIRSDLFGWMTTHPAPETPSALFIIKWRERLEEAYLQRIAFEKRMKLTPEEREVSRLVKKGMSIDDAKAKVYGPVQRQARRPALKTIPITVKRAPLTTRKQKGNGISSFSLSNLSVPNTYDNV